MPLKTSRLIIQGKPGEKGRRYHFDIPFPNGHINITDPREFSGLDRLGSYWLNPRPELRDVPVRIGYLVDQMCRLKMDLPVSAHVIHSMGVRTHHLRVALNRGLEGAQVDEALRLLDQTVIMALKQGLEPDHEDGYRWFGSPGLKVRVNRREDPYMVNAFDPEGDREAELDPKVEWALDRREQGVHSWENISLWDAQRRPQEQLELMHRLMQVPGLNSFMIHPATRTQAPRVALMKGLAWRWSVIEKKLDEIGLIVGSRIFV